MTSIKFENNILKLNPDERINYNKDKYKFKPRTSRPSYGIFGYITGNTIEENKYLMVMRRNSYAYEEFIRGNYNIDDLNYIRNLISRLTKEEGKKIIDSEFDNLWNDLNKAYSITTTDPTKLRLAKENFNKIKNNKNLYNLSLENIQWIEPEWCFSKGKKNNNLEHDIDCSMREFWEETKITEKEYTIKNILPIETIYIADNGVTYNNKFYFAEMKECKEISIDESDESQKAEIGKIQWLTKSECKNKIRSYHIYIFDILNKGTEICEQLINNK